MVLPISASQVSRITGMSHWCLPFLPIFLTVLEWLEGQDYSYYLHVLTSSIGTDS
jgi:hypothetical protein